MLLWLASNRLHNSVSTAEIREFFGFSEYCAFHN